MLDFLGRHPIFTLSVFGSLLGTILSYIMPSFTRNYLCADENFRFGSLGFAVFVHDGFLHLLGNLFFMIPGSLLCEKFYNHKLIIALIIVFAFLDCIRCIPMKSASCGYSGVSYMLCSMACIWKFHWWGFLILAILFVSSFITDKSDYRSDKFAHIFGFIFGSISGTLIQIFA